MKHLKYIVGLFFAFMSAATAQTVCNDPSGFVKLKGQFVINDALLLGPDCQTAHDGGPVISINALQGFISGLILSNDSVSPNTVIDVAPGIATSADATSTISLAAISKNMNAPFVAGIGNGCADGAGGYTALAASTWYHIFAIQRTDTNVSDVLCSKSVLPSFPVNYSKQRRLGSVKTDAASHIVSFFQNQDWFLWGTRPAGPYDYTGTNMPAGVVTVSLVSVPPGVRVQMIALADFGDTASNAVTWRLYSPDTPNYFSGGGLGPTGYDAGGAAFTQEATVTVWTNTSAQILSQFAPAFANASTFWNLQVTGWIDPRGK